jgi:hypothetical protein
VGDEESCPNAGEAMRHVAATAMAEDITKRIPNCSSSVYLFPLERRVEREMIAITRIAEMTAPVVGSVIA